MKTITRFRHPFLIVTIAAAVLAPPIPVTDTFSLRPEFILAGILFLWLLPTEGLAAFKHPAFKWMGLLAVLIVISMGYSALVIERTISLQDTFEVAKIAVYAVIFYAASARSISPSQSSGANSWIQLIFLSSASVGLLQYFDLLGVNAYLTPLYAGAAEASSMAGNRIVGTTSNPNYYGMMMLFGICLALAGFLWANSWRKRWLSILSLMACTAAMLLASSRTVMAVIPIAVLYISVQFVVRSRADKAKLKRIGMIAGLLIFLLVLVLLLLPSAWFTRMGELLNVFESESMQLKFVNWQEQWSLYLQSPLFGHGPAKGLINLNVDNEWLLFLTRYGVGGPVLAFLLGFSLFAGANDLVHRSSASEARGFALALQAILLTAAIFMVTAAVYHHQQLMACLLLLFGLGQGFVSGVTADEPEGLSEYSVLK